MTSRPRRPLVRILLIRHGPSAASSPATRLDREGVVRWRAEYDAASIAPDGRPPLSLIERVAETGVAASSDLPRAAASAARLWPERSVLLSPLFREIPLRIPPLTRVRMPLAVWELGIHLQWGLDILSDRRLAPDDQQRVDAAAAWCEDTCRERESSFVLAIITHGVFRRALADRLMLNGWKRSSRRRRYAPWSVWTVERMGTSSRRLANG